MKLAAALLAELEQEMRTTRAVIARVPDDRPDWKPHEKSFSLAHLTQLVATMPGWLLSMLGATELDLAGAEGYRNQSTESLLAQFDDLVGRARAALERAEDEDFQVPWSLRRGDTVIFTLPRVQVVRMHMNHMVHHRAQLGVYLRLLDVPVPQMYGPTADEKW